MKENKTLPVILITGCSGLIGSSLSHALTDKYQVVGLDIKKPLNFPQQASWFKCDLTSDDSVTDVLAKVREQFGHFLTSVVHLAAFYDFSGKPNELYNELTVQGTRRLTDALRLWNVEQFIFSSSLLVMEPVEQVGEQLTERSDVLAEWDYPRSKLEAEKVLADKTLPFSTVILRIAGVYNEKCNSLPISEHIRRILEKDFESYFFPGDPDHGQPFVHLDDLVACIANTVANRDKLSRKELFLIAEPETLSHRELQTEIGRLIHGEAWPTIRIPKSVAKVGAWVKDQLTSEEQFIKPWMIDLADDHYAVKIRAANDSLDWKPQHRLKDTLPQIIKDLRANPKAWYRRHDLSWPDEDLGSLIENPDTETHTSL
ncbi:MAG: NAD(P)-dependent oxidoreductase [Bdellovibrionales bacterium]|nr:NAD(P)-dependent oxidoreductase [Bdellovibrionales bacterium]